MEAFREPADRDGRWLAYVSNESGRFEIYVQPYPGLGGKWHISTEGGSEQFCNHTDKMMAVAIHQAADFCRWQSQGTI